MGSDYRTPDPRSIGLSGKLGLDFWVDPIKALFSPADIPLLFKDRVYITSHTDMTTFEDGSKLSQITAFKIKIGDSDLQLKNHYIDFPNVTGDCDGNTHCDKNIFNSLGFRWNLTDPLQYRSNVYFEYDLIKFSNDPFEPNVIKMTSNSHPWWPMLMKSRTVGQDPGVLLGYILRVGFLLQIADKVPQLIPFLKNVMGIVEVGGELRADGSAILTDAPDALSLNGIVQVRYPDYYTVGFSLTLTTEMHPNAEPHFREFNRNHLTAMFFVRVPLIEPNYKDAEILPRQYSKKFQIKNVKIYTRFYEGKPAHMSTDELEPKTLETGMAVAAAYGRFIFDLGLMQTQTKEVLPGRDPGDFQTVQLALKYDINKRLKVVISGHADNFKSGHGELGVGTQILPFSETAAESLGLDVSLTTLVHPVSNYPAIARSNQSLDGFNLPRNRIATIYLEAFKTLHFPNWTGIGKLGFRPKFGTVLTTYFGENAKFGYSNISFHARLVNDKVGCEVGTIPYKVDFNFGASSGLRTYGQGPRQGMQGPNEGYQWMFGCDLMVTIPYIASQFSGDPNLEPNSQEKTVTEYSTDSSQLKPQTQKSEISIHQIATLESKDFPDSDRSQDQVYTMLSIIADAIARNDQSPDALKAYELVPHLVLNIAKKELNLARYLIAKKKYSQAREILESLEVIYNSSQDYATIELPRLKNLEHLLKFSFSQNPNWKQNIQAVGREVLDETFYCIGVTLKNLKHPIESEEYFAKTSYEPPNQLMRILNGFLKSQHYCVK